MKKELDLSGFDEEVQKDPTELDLSGFDEEVNLDEDGPQTSQIMAGLVGAGQGATFGAGDEIGSAALALLSKGADLLTGPSQEELLNQQLKAQGFTGSALETKDESLKDLYKRYRDTTREYQDKLQKEHGGTYFGGELVGGLGTGGVGAVGNLAKGATLGAKVARGAAQGAIQGGLSGAGYSEAEDLSGLAKDVAIGTGIGTVAGGGLPVAGRGVSKVTSKLTEGAKELAEKAPTLAKPFQFASKYGLTTQKERQAIYEKDVKSFLGSIKDKFEEIGMSKELAESKAKDLKKTIDLTQDLSGVSEKLRREASLLSGSEQSKMLKFADDVDSLATGGFSTAERELQEELAQEIQRKLDASTRKEVAAPIKAESKLVQKAAKTGDEIESISQKQLGFEDVSELKYDTQGGKIDRSRAVMSRQVPDESGEMTKQLYSQNIVQDVTPFQPSSVKIFREGNEVIGEYLNEATGEIFRKYKKLPPSGVDFSNMTIDDLIEHLSVTGKRAWDKNNESSAMYQELWKATRNALERITPEMSTNKAEQAKLYQLLSVLRLDKDMVSGNLSHQDLVKAMNTLKGNIDLEKSYVRRNFLTEGSPVEKQLNSLDLTQEVEKILEGSTSATGEFTKAGITQKAAGFTSSVAGSIYGKATRSMQPVKNIANKVSQLTDQQLTKASTNLSNSQVPGVRALGKQLQFALQQEGPIKNAAIWSLSQQPAFREAIRQSASGENEESFTKEALGTEALDIPAPSNMQEEQSSGRIPQGTSDLSSEMKGRIMGFENNKSLPFEKSGYDKQKGRWFPHKSLEGGEDTLGYGTKLVPGKFTEEQINKFYREGITEDEAISLMTIDLDKAKKDTEKLISQNNITINDEQKEALVEMVYQMGAGGVSKFRKMISALQVGDFEEAAKQALDSKWAKKDSPDRARSVASRLLPKEPQINREPQGLEESQTVSIEQIQNLQNRLNAHSKYVNSGGNAVYSSTGERLMESVNQLDLPDEVKQEAEDAIVDGDIQKLRQMLDSLRAL
jgi:lysozyme